MPVAMLEAVRIEHGAIIMPCTRKEPEEIGAPILFGACTTSAKAAMSAGDIWHFLGQRQAAGRA